MTTYVKTSKISDQPLLNLPRYPLLGAVSALVSSFIAVLLVPTDPEPAGALFDSALIMSIGLAFAPMLAAIRNPKTIFLGEHLLVLGPIYWILLDLLQSAYDLRGLKSEEVVLGFTAIGLFGCGVWVAAFYRAWKIPSLITNVVTIDFSGHIYFGLAVASFVLAFLRFAIPANFNIPAMISYLGESRWAAPWSRGQLGGWDSFLDHLAYFGYLLPTLTVIVARRIGWWRFQTMLCVLMSIIISIFLMQGGGRRLIGIIFGMALILWVLSEKELRPKHVIFGPIIVGLLLLTMQLMVEFRSYGYGELFTRENKQELFERRTLHVDDNFYRLCQIIHFIPNEYSYVYHQYVIWVIVRPIPRVLWENKPVDPGFDLTEALGMQGVSLTSSVIGELYMSFGLFAVAIGGWFYGRIAGMASNLLKDSVDSFSSIVVYSTVMMALFTGLRSMLELILTSYVVLAWVGLSKVYQAFRKRQRGQILNKLPQTSASTPLP